MSLPGHSHDATCKGTEDREDREGHVSFSSPGMEDSPEECVSVSQMERQEGRSGRGEITLQALVFVVL